MTAITDNPMAKEAVKRLMSVLGNTPSTGGASPQNYDGAKGSWDTVSKAVAAVFGILGILQILSSPLRGIVYLGIATVSVKANRIAQKYFNAKAKGNSFDIAKEMKNDPLVKKITSWLSPNLNS
jgi:hypothetical protein